MLSHSDIENLVLQYGSPFYLVDRNRFESNFDELTAAFRSHWSPFILAYSYKTNYLPYLCDLVKQKGGWAEVVSRMEYELALKVGHDSKKIIFNGPVKTAADIEWALDNGSMVNVDSEAELMLVIDYAKQHPAKEIPVGLRINIGLSDAAGQSHIQNSLKVGRFGLDPSEISNLKSQISKLKVANLKVIGLHGHTSTTDRSQWCFEAITKTLCDVAQTYFSDTVEFINAGGGFFGHMHPDMPFMDAPSFDDYAEVICSVLNKNCWARENKPTLVIEPGVAMVADAVSFITKVISVKPIRDRSFVTVDGSAFNTKPTFHSINMPHRIICQGGEDSMQTFDIVGSTCMEKDILLKDITAPLPQTGDFVKIDSVGAYTLVMTPPFINPAPAVMADEDGDFKLIRKKQTLEEIFNNYIFV